MSLLALKASIGGAPPLAEHPRDLGGKSAGGSEFAAIMSALAGEGSSDRTRAPPATKGRRQRARSRFAERKHAEIAEESSSIDAGLAGLVYGALAAPVGMTPSQFVPPDAGGKNVAQQGVSGSNSAAANGSPAVGGALWRALEGRGVGVSSDQATGSPDAAALAGVVDGAADGSNGGERRLLSRPRGYAIPHLSRGRQRRAKRSQKSDLALAGAFAPRKRPRRPGPARRGLRGRQRRGGVDRQRDAARQAVDFGRQRIAKRLGPDPSAGREPAAIGPSASPGAVNLGVNPVTTGVGPIPLGQLAERLATAASALTSRAPRPTQRPRQAWEAPKRSRNSRSISIPPISAPCR